MVQRPISLTIVAWLFIVVGGAGLIDAVLPLFDAGSRERLAADARELRDLAFVLTLRLLALVGGAFVLRGADWSRWLLAMWMAAHVAISLQHSWGEALIHAVIFSAVASLLFRPRSGTYFRERGAPAEV